MKLIRARAALTIAAWFCSIVTTQSAVYGQPAAPPKADKADKAALDEAKDRFKRGLTLYQEGSLDAALIEFERAFALSPNYKIMYNIATVHRDRRNYVKSLQWLVRFLAEGGKQIDARRKKEVEGEIDQLKKFVATIDIKTSVEGAEVKIDDDVIGLSPTPPGFQVNAGTRKLTATKEGRLPASKTLTLAGGDSISVDLVLEEPPAAPPPPPPVTVVAPPPPAPPPPPPSRFTTLSYVGLGVGGALAVGAGVTGVLALGASKDLDKTAFVGDSPNQAALDKQSQTKRLALVTDILVIASAATLATTLVLTLTRDPKSEESAWLQRPAVAVGPGSAFFRGEF